MIHPKSHATEPGSKVWVLAVGRWRRALVVGMAGTRIVVRFAIPSRKAEREMRFRLSDDRIQPEPFDPTELDARGYDLAGHYDTPVSEAPAPEPKRL